MQTRQRWVASIAIGLLIGAAGCGDSGSDKGGGDGKADAGGGGNGGGNDPTNNGGGTDANGGTGTEEDAGDDGPPPDLNFIPANEGKCDIDEKPELRAAAKTALTEIVGYAPKKAADLELCPTTASDRACAPCASNPFLSWVTAVDAADTTGKENRMALADFFRRALQYPFRDLLLLDAEGENPGLVLAQGRASCTGTEEEVRVCTKFALQPESMEGDCSTITQNLTVASTTPEGDVTTVVSKESANAFGFLVPLTESLPNFPLANPTVVDDGIPNACPTALQVTTEDEFSDFLACNPKLKVLLTAPTMKTVVDADGASCFQLSGLVDVTTLPKAARMLVPTDSYEEPDAFGFIRLNLSARLIDATVTVDSSLAEEAK